MQETDAVRAARAGRKPPVSTRRNRPGACDYGPPFGSQTPHRWVRSRP